MLGGWPCGGVCDPADMHKSLDGLQALVRQHLGDDTLSGRWYVFINRRRALCKVLCFEAGGFCIWAKRLEKGLLTELGRWSVLPPWWFKQEMPSRETAA